MVEVMIALVLLSMGVLGLAMLQSKSTRWSIDAEDRNRAALLADELAAVMLISRTVRLPADELERMEARVAAVEAGGLPSGTVEVVENAYGAEIVIRWQSRAVRGPTQLQLSTQVVLASLPASEPSP